MPDHAVADDPRKRTHAFTIDVEDYWCITARDWLRRDMEPTRAVVCNSDRMLETLDRYGVKATFFILGEVARSFPDLVRRIAAAGHELGVHGFTHRPVFKLSPDDFRTEIGDAKSLIEDIAGTAAPGHRAPAFSIVPQSRWALDVLAGLGFRFDSSIFPIAGRRYGWPGFRTDIHEISLDDHRTIIEAPLTTVSILGRRLPVCGGGYLRHFPYEVTRWAIRRVQRERPAILYMHPYEIELPPGPLDTSALDRSAARRAQRFHRLQLRNRHTVEAKIFRLLDQFDFAPLGKVIDDVLRLGPRSCPN
jgi:polysaccharide deacetylase family protein (PEP-CTERM system associated)